MVTQLDTTLLESSPAELASGETQEEMASLEHGAIGAALNAYIYHYAKQNHLGRVFDAQTTFKMVGTPPTRQPDVAFVKQDKLPPDLKRTADFAPDLAIEVVSENDTVFSLLEKINQYQKSGVKLIWIVYPPNQTVAIYRISTGAIPETLSLDKELDGEDILPGFKLSVKAIFE